MKTLTLTDTDTNAEITDPGERDIKKQLLSALGAVRDGDFSARLPSDWIGLDGKVADVFNHITARLERSNANLLRLRHAVGEEGKLGERLTLGDSVGGWAERIEAINVLVDDLSLPTEEMGRVIGAVAKGDLSQSMPLEVRGRPLLGEYLSTAKLVNGMVGQLGAFSVEVIRVAREVGTEGKLGGQAQVKGVSGVWKELTESVNQMAGNLTAQVRNIAEVTIAVANGDLSKKSPWTCAVKFSSSRKRSTSWSISSVPSPLKSPVSRARSAPMASLVARPPCRGSPGLGKI